MIALAEMGAGSLAAQPKPWACNGCRRLVLRPGRHLLCATDDGAQQLASAFDAAPAWCPRTSPPPLPRSTR